MLSGTNLDYFALDLYKRVKFMLNFFMENWCQVLVNFLIRLNISTSIIYHVLVDISGKVLKIKPLLVLNVAYVQYIVILFQ